MTAVSLKEKAGNYKGDLMKTILKTFSLKRIFFLFTILTTGMLFIVILFAGKQYILYKHCDKLVTSSQQLLFQFTGIKEHISETLLNKQHLDCAELIKELQELDSRLQSIIEDILIPEELKISHINQVDLLAITVSLRRIQNARNMPTGSTLTTLSTQLRDIYSKLSRFNQLINRYTQKQLMELHQALVGLLAIIVALVSIMLLVINKYITSPIIHYCKVLFPKENNTCSLFSLHKTIQYLTSQKTNRNHNYTASDNNISLSLYRHDTIGQLFFALSNELTNLSNGTINYSQAILDISNDSAMEEDLKQLIQALLLEEKKLSGLLADMTAFTNENIDGKTKILSLNKTIEQVTSLLHGVLNNDGIKLTTIKTDPATTLNYHVSDLQLILLSILLNCKALLNNRSPVEETGTKNIAIILDTQTLSQENITICVQDNGIDAKEQPAVIQACETFLQTFNGTITMERTHEKMNNCTIIIPKQETNIT